jgi:hypothetical protein
LLISAHLSQGIEVKVEPKLSNPIEIGLKDFTQIFFPMGVNHSYEYLSIKEGSFLVCFDCHIEISQAPVPLAVVLVHHWKAPMSRGVH